MLDESEKKNGLYVANPEKEASDSPQKAAITATGKDGMKDVMFGEVRVRCTGLTAFERLLQRRHLCSSLF